MTTNSLHPETIAVHGAESGPYIVLPLVGPSSARGLIGLVVDTFTNPFNYVGEAYVYPRVATEIVHVRSENIELLDDIEETSFDPYTALRSAYIQNRNSKIENGKPQNNL